MFVGKWLKIVLISSIYNVGIGGDEMSNKRAIKRAKTAGIPEILQRRLLDSSNNHWSNGKAPKVTPEIKKKVAKTGGKQEKLQTWIIKCSNNHESFEKASKPHSKM